MTLPGRGSSSYKRIETQAKLTKRVEVNVAFPIWVDLFKEFYYIRRTLNKMLVTSRRSLVISSCDGFFPSARINWPSSLVLIVPVSCQTGGNQSHSRPPWPGGRCGSAKHEKASLRCLQSQSWKDNAAALISNQSTFCRNLGLSHRDTFWSISCNALLLLPESSLTSTAAVAAAAAPWRDWSSPSVTGDLVGEALLEALVLRKVPVLEL